MKKKWEFKGANVKKAVQQATPPIPAKGEVLDEGIERRSAETNRKDS